MVPSGNLIQQRGRARYDIIQGASGSGRTPTYHQTTSSVPQTPMLLIGLPGMASKGLLDKHPQSVDDVSVHQRGLSPGEGFE
jgi:predicted ABC-type ATPase